MNSSELPRSKSSLKILLNLGDGRLVAGVGLELTPDFKLFFLGG